MSAHFVKRAKYDDSRSLSQDQSLASSYPAENLAAAIGPAVAAAYPSTYPVDEPIDPAAYFLHLSKDPFFFAQADALFAPPPFAARCSSSTWPAAAIANWVEGHPQAAAEPSFSTTLSLTADHIATHLEEESSAPGFENPFRDNAREWIPTLGQARHFEIPEINGYIKCRWSQSRKKPTTSIQPPPSAPSVGIKRPLTVVNTAPAASVSSAPQSSVPPGTQRHIERVQRPPPGLGFRRLSRPSGQLFLFYRTAWCAGRTILHDTNCWYHFIPAMAARDDGVHHAMLALAGTYVLDYVPDDRIRIRSNTNYNKAVELLTEGLDAFQSSRTQGDDEPLVASIALLNMMDVISPERRRPKSSHPRWLEGAKVACQILRMTDSGYRYWKTQGPEPSKSRTASTIISSRVVILALPMTPLGYISTDNERFQFMLAHSSETATREIHGACGCSPSLLHRFAQITYLTSLVVEDPGSPILQVTAERMLQQLRSLKQWFGLKGKKYGYLGYAEDGYSSTEALLTDCDRHTQSSNGVVKDVAGMTYLTAEAWRLAAIIYLQCRLLRLPRSHNDVVFNLAKLSECVRRMPTSGILFTAQAPFFPVFLLGLLAPEKPRQAAIYWFESVTSTSVRSSVPPAYRAMERIRSWMDEWNLGLNDDKLPVALDERPSWWEDLVLHVRLEEGVLCLV